MMPTVTDAMVAEIIRRLPHERIATGAYTTAELTSWVKNLAENLLYLDGSRRGVALAWKHHNVAHNLNLTGQQPPESDPPPGHDNQFMPAIAWVYRRHQAALEAQGHALPDLIQQTTAISCRKRFKEYDGRASLPKVIFFYAWAAARELRRRMLRRDDPFEEFDRYVKAGMQPARELLQTDDPFEEFDRYGRMGIITEVDKHILIDSYAQGLSDSEIARKYKLQNPNIVYQHKDRAHARIAVFCAIEKSCKNGITKEEISAQTGRKMTIVESILKDFFRELKIVVHRKADAALSASDKYYLKAWDPAPFHKLNLTKTRELLTFLKKKFPSKKDEEP
ncbi:MAG: hypothetical protein HYZ81_04610 [Nitrospinae bacterium]|nr:hypothetical protein [Nitrospinota bacterium]